MEIQVGTHQSGLKWTSEDFHGVSRLTSLSRRAPACLRNDGAGRDEGPNLTALSKYHFTSYISMRKYLYFK